MPLKKLSPKTLEAMFYMAIWMLYGALAMWAMLKDYPYANLILQGSMNGQLTEQYKDL